MGHEGIWFAPLAVGHDPEIYIVNSIVYYMASILYYVCQYFTLKCI